MPRASLYLALCLAVVSATASANTSFELNYLRLDKDGSQEPPGDAIKVEVLQLAGGSPLTVQVTGFELEDPEDSESVRAMRAQSGADCADARGAGGELQVEKFVEGAAETNQKHVFRFVFPYSCFDLANGDHHIFYELRIKNSDTSAGSDEVFRTRLTVVTVGDDTRDFMVKPGKSEPVTYERKTIQAYTSVNGEKKLIEVPVMQPAAQQAPPSKPTKVDVEIPGGFKRREALNDSRKFTASSADFEPEQKRIIYYATNRAVAEERGDAYKRFASKSGTEIFYGSALTNIPIHHHKAGELKTSSGWWRHDPDKVFHVEAIRNLMASDFFQIMGRNDTFVFVHGFNTTFSEAILRAAQLHHDLRFPGKTVAFSWPSHGRILKYTADGKIAAESGDALATVLDRLIENAAEQGRKVHVLAHSMGSRVLLSALSQLVETYAGEQVFGQIVFAAPDADANRFASVIPRVVTLANRITYYYSDEDIPLVASRALNRTDRAGATPFFFAGMETINANAANSPFVTLGHTYFAANDRLLLDINLNIVQAMPATERRPPLKEAESIAGFEGLMHFSFPVLQR